MTCIMANAEPQTMPTLGNAQVLVSELSAMKLDF
jgi:hypothetical protein